MRQFFDLQTEHGRRAPGRAALLDAAGTLHSTGVHVVIHNLKTGKVVSLPGPESEDPTIDVLAAQFRAERPPRDSDRANQIAHAWERQWKTSIEQDELAIEVSVVPTRRLRDEVDFIIEFHALVSQLDAWAGKAGETAATAASGTPARVATDLKQLRDVARRLVGRLPPLNHPAAATIMTRAWWTAQLVQAADAAHSWCVARCPRPRLGLWWHIVGLLWYHGWDLESHRKADVDRLKMDWSRRAPSHSTRSFS